ncbi:hypothetical protein HBE96_23265 [Clostridium sp. P21]|uniref:Gp28/Gp37-like domain-containing protein n=1 Tax=Clostridium muellerianum TaxID=2716538 RepID=A0A7Y0ELU6_9CLOT|nr:siphovirus ReqiPepy6 Gp37-like family protein [Clostridium muellerianum]NMM65502.1 hypothetical protein [Clostridium muellerianum]
MELYIFDRELNFKGILESYSNLRWVRKYHKAGEFELHCALTPEILELLKRENILWKKADDEAGFIEYRNLKQDKNGQEILVVKGRFLTKYLDRRIIWGSELLQTTVENAMRTLVNNNCINPIDKNRIIPNLIIEENKGYIQNINYHISYKNLLEELESISNVSNLGYKIKFNVNDKKLVFDVYEGKDLTVNQAINPICIFSKEFENILEQEYTDSINNYRNVSLVAGAGEGKERIFTTIGQANGLDRFELFTDARDLQDKKTVGEQENQHEEDIPIQEYMKMLEQRGIEKLAECKEITTFDSKVNVNSSLKYKDDFNLGDVVTCMSKKWGLMIDARITEIEEVYDEKGLSINITFGNTVPTVLDKIKSLAKQQIGGSIVTSITNVNVNNIDGGSFV